MIDQTKKYYLKKQLANKNLNMYKIYYFSYFAALGAFLPLYPVYLSEVLAFPNAKIGIILSINPLVSILFQPLWGIINAKFKLDKKLVVVSLIMVNLAVAGIITSNDFSFVVMFTFFYGLFVSAIGPINDGLTVLFTKRYGFKYGNVRIWGSIGYAFSSFIIGFLVSFSNYTVIIYAMTAFMLVSLGSFLQLKQVRKLKINKMVYKQNNFLSILKNRRYLLFLLFAALGIGSISAAGNFMLITLSTLGATSSQVGTTSSILVIFEILTMMIILKYNHKYSDFRFIVLSLLVHIPVFIIFIYSDNIYFLMLGMVIRGISQGLFIPVILSIISSLISTDQLSNGIIIYSVVSIGLTGYIITFGGGYFSDYFGMDNLFIFLLSSVLLSLLIAFLLNRSIKKVNNE